MCDLETARDAYLFTAEEAMKLLNFDPIEPAKFNAKMKKAGITPNIKKGAKGFSKYTYNDLKLYCDFYHRANNLNDQWVTDRINAYMKGYKTKEVVVTVDNKPVAKVDVVEWTYKVNMLSKIYPDTDIMEMVVDFFCKQNSKEIKNRVSNLKDIVEFAKNL